MNISELNFDLPRELIAYEPSKKRGDDRLLYLNRSKGTIKDCNFDNFSDFLPEKSVIILNDSKVYKARLLFSEKNEATGEILLIEKTSDQTWICMMNKSQHRYVGSHYKIPGGRTAEILKSLDNGFKIIRFSSLDYEYLEQYGQIPLPPYINRDITKQDSERYQTIYAEHLGSCASPTAGLHFTKAVLENLKARGHQLAFITLHVGPGTFAPIRTQNITNHIMHNEYYTISPQTASIINNAYREKRTVIAIGTTSCRALESAFDQKNISIFPKTDSTSIFIYPGYHFSAIQGLLTNFHTPKSTLLALVYAFAGCQVIKNAYTYAINKSYRFFSYGDAMLIL